MIEQCSSASSLVMLHMNTQYQLLLLSIQHPATSHAMAFAFSQAKTTREP